MEIPVDFKLEGLKVEKVTMTIGLCCNADGSEKLKPIVFAHARRTRCFGKFNPLTIFYYYNNQMTMYIFQDWLTKLNFHFSLFHRKILLLVDNFLGLNLLIKFLQGLSNVKIEYFAPNMTSHIERLDAGIIQ